MNKSMILSIALLITLAAYAVAPREAAQDESTVATQAQLEAQVQEESSIKTQEQLIAERSHSSYAPGTLHHINHEGDFARAIQSGFVVVDIYTHYCPPCRRLAPLIEGFVQEYSHVSFIKVDGEKNSARGILSQYHISGFPTLLLFKDGVLVQKLVGLRDINEYRNIFNSLYPR
jgi:thioredoxin 1